MMAPTVKGKGKRISKYRQKQTGEKLLNLLILIKIEKKTEGL